MADFPEFKLPGSGLKCGHCGEPLRRCDETFDGTSSRIRYRYCRSCKKKNTCVERVEATDDVRKYFRKNPP